MKEDEIKKLLLQYNDIIKKLKEGGVIRSSKLVADYGEYIVCKKLGLKCANSPVNPYYDAFDDKNLKYQIKSRKATLWNKPKLFPAKKEQLKHSDFIIYIEFDNEWNIAKLLKIPSNKVKPNDQNRVHLNKFLVKEYNILE